MPESRAKWTNTTLCNSTAYIWNTYLCSWRDCFQIWNALIYPYKRRSGHSWQSVWWEYSPIFTIIKHLINLIKMASNKEKLLYTWASQSLNRNSLRVDMSGWGILIGRLIEIEEYCYMMIHYVFTQFLCVFATFVRQTHVRWNMYYHFVLCECIKLQFPIF